jgi:hypothetical protein
MKKISFLFFLLGMAVCSFAQDTTVIKPSPVQDSILHKMPPPPSQSAQAKQMAAAAMNNRANDHLLIQFGYLGWSQKPDSINTRGFPNTFNVYFMFDLPFKTNPHISVGIGAGVSTTNMFFEKTFVDIPGKNHSTLTFQDLSDTTHFKKFKLMNTYLEAPIELRYSSNPANSNRSFKASVGAKIGVLVGASTKGKNYQTSTGQTLVAYTSKEKSKRFFNSTRLNVTGRVGYGFISVFANYQVNAFVKEGFGPDVRPYSIGLTLSGL